MKNSKTLSLALALGVNMLAPTMAWAQATTSILISVNPQIYKKQIDGSTKVDLIEQIKKSNPAASAAGIEIQAVQVGAKTNIGGAQLFLKINNEYAASVVIETDPDKYGNDDLRTFEKHILKNVDRTKINSALLHIQNGDNVKLSFIEVILGAVQEPAVFGRYAQEQASVVGAGNLDDDRDMRPTDEAVSAIYGTYYGNDPASIAAQEQARLEREQQAAQASANDEQARNLRSNLASGIAAAEAGDQYVASQYLSNANDYYNREKRNAIFGQKILLEDEVVAYIARLQSIYNNKIMQAQNREQEIRRQQQAERQRIASQRPQINYNVKDKCVKARNKKIGNKKEFCIGEFIAGVWPQHNPPQIFSVNAKTKEITLMFDYTNTPLVMSVDSLPDQR